MSNTTSKLVTDLVESLPRKLTDAFSRFPKHCFDSWQYTEAGNNFGHPIVIGELVRIAWEFDGIGFVGVDLHLNDRSGAKFQPDVVALDVDLTPYFYIDYESPNSSDSRIPPKDVIAFNRWRTSTGCRCPYVIITALPDAISHTWKLEWTAKNKWNNHLQGRRDEIRANPFRFWYSYYASKCSNCNLTGITFLNINGRTVERVNLSDFI